MRTAGALLLALGGLVRAGKYGGAALTWAARDPEGIERFVNANVPAGSDVIGQASLYFYAVERSGSRMIRAERTSYADWATWAPRAAVAPPPPGAPSAGTHALTRRRFFLWQADEAAPTPPNEYVCVDRRLVAVYEPPPTSIGWLGPFDWLAGTPGYPSSSLYELGPACAPAAPRSAQRTPQATEPPPARSSRLASQRLASHSPPKDRG